MVKWGYIRRTNLLPRLYLLDIVTGRGSCFMKPYYNDEAAGITIYHGDCREVLPTLDPVDLVLTDPPYPKEFDYVWDILAGAADVMRDGANLFTYCGHYQLPLVLNALSRTLRYH